MNTINKHRSRQEVSATKGVNEVDYVKLGQRIRKVRTEQRLQQAELAYRAGITTSHMSHIETAQTKLALPTIVKIANALFVSVDELLYDSLEQVRPVYDKRIAETLSDCDPDELQALSEVIGTIKTLVRKKHKASDTL